MKTGFKFQLANGVAEEGLQTIVTLLEKLQRLQKAGPDHVRWLL